MMYSKFKKLESIYYFCEIDYVFKTEQWKPVVGYEGYYEVSDLGRVKSVSRKISIFKTYYISKDRIMTQGNHTAGYFTVMISKNNKYRPLLVHQLMAMAFLNHVPERFKIVVDHKDNNKQNNLLSNLQVISNRENLSKDATHKSGFLGVTKRFNRYQSKITINSVPITLGYFDCPIEASNAYQKRLKEYEENGI